MKQTKNENNLERSGKKFIYSVVKEYEFDPEEVLALASQNRVRIDEITKQISAAKGEQRVLNDFLSKNKKLIQIAKDIDEKRFCEKCGMDFHVPANRNNRSNKTKEPYKVLCTNCATKEGL